MEHMNQVKETFLCLVKWFLIFVVLNNVGWIGIFTYYIRKSYDVEPLVITANQDGVNNKQAVNK